MKLFDRGKKIEPTYSQQVAYIGEGRPQTDYEPSSNVHHLFTIDETVLELLKANPQLSPSAIAFSPTSDTNFLKVKNVELLVIKIRKAFKYMQLNMTRSERRAFLPTIKFLEANAYARAYNNVEGNKIKTLVRQEKIIRTGELKKSEL